MNDLARTPEHEQALHTSHIVSMFEMEEAKQALSEWNDREALLEVDTREWREVIMVAATIQGWIAVAIEHGNTRRSLRRTIEVEVERRGISALEVAA